MTFVWEDRPDDPVNLHAGDSLVIEPATRHHVEPGPDVRFTVAFHR
jgi:quercetin dioxygenase-like cupin family protein